MKNLVLVDWIGLDPSVGGLGWVGSRFKIFRGLGWVRQLVGWVGLDRKNGSTDNSE